MGIGTSATRHLVKLCAAQKLSGRCLTLGRQSVQVTRPRLEEILDDYGYAATLGPRQAAVEQRLAALREQGRDMSFDPDGRARGYVSDHYLFAALGFDAMHSVDASAYEGCDVEFDLNRPGLAAATGGGYQLVVDAGTLEHVFHLPNALANIFDALAVGGVALHHSPTNNYVDHGFYQFSPTLFFDYYAANGFTVLDHYFVRHTARDGGNADAWMLAEYRPGSLAGVSFGGLDAQMYMSVFAVRKEAASTGTAIPQQGHYRREWARRRGG
ncbi:MAG TPA: hypothetical protein VEB20_05235 [Azospirillaceae bacterium]|nr:hypothetical protein [Azospirillaceae bacterium]